MAYCDLEDQEIKNHKPKVVFVNSTLGFLFLMNVKFG